MRPPLFACSLKLSKSVSLAGMAAAARRLAAYEAALRDEVHLGAGLFGPVVQRKLIAVRGDGAPIRSPTPPDFASRGGGLADASRDISCRCTSMLGADADRPGERST